MCPCEFARIGGGILLAAGVLGLLRVFGPTEGESVLGAVFWMSTAESSLILALGAILVGASRTSPVVERPIVLLCGWFFLLLFAASVLTPAVLFLHFERPLESFLYLALGAWAVFAGFCKDPVEETTAPKEE